MVKISTAQSWSLSIVEFTTPTDCDYPQKWGQLRHDDEPKTDSNQAKQKAVVGIIVGIVKIYNQESP